VDKLKKNEVDDLLLSIRPGKDILKALLVIWFFIRVFFLIRWEPIYLKGKNIKL